jgi:hypothetical protein
VAGRKERASLIVENNLSRNWAARLEFVGAEPVIPRGRLSTPTQISFFKGTPDQWRTGLPTYAELIYEGLWPGVDLVFSGAAGRIKYAFIVHPGADPERIRLAYHGAEIGLIAEGGLRVDTPAGGFTDQAPIAWQEEGAARLEVPCAYALNPAGRGGGRSYGFKVGLYDPARPLILDPEFIVYSGFLGGSGDDTGAAIAVDGLGNAYVTGTTFSADFPRTVGLPHAGGSRMYSWPRSSRTARAWSTAASSAEANSISVLPSP